MFSFLSPAPGKFDLQDQILFTYDSAYPPPDVNKMSLKHTITTHRNEITLVITGPHLRIERFLAPSPDNHEDFHMRQLVEMLEGSSFRAFEFGSSLLDNVVLDDHPCILGVPYLGPTLNMCHDRLVLYLDVAADLRFAKELLMGIASAIAAVRDSYMRSFSAPSKTQPDARTVSTLRNAEGVLIMLGSAGKMQVPNAMIPELIIVLRSLNIDDVANTPVIDGALTLDGFFLTTAMRQKHIVLNYVREGYSSSIDLYHECVGPLIAALNSSVSWDNYTCMLDIMRVNGVCTNTKTSMVEHGCKVRIISRNSNVIIPIDKIVGRSAHLREMLGNIRHPNRQNSIIALGGIPFIVMMNPSADKYNYPVFKIGEAIAFNMQTDLAECVHILIQLIRFSNKHAREVGEVRLARVETNVLISADNNTVSVYDNLNPRVAVIPSLFEEEFCKNSYGLHHLLGLYDNSWSGRYTIIVFETDKCAFELFTTGNYREVCLKFVNAEGTQCLKLTMDEASQFLICLSQQGGIKNKHCADYRVLADTISERFRMAPVLPEKEMQNHNSAPRIIFQTNRGKACSEWAKADSEGHSKFLAYVMSAPAEVRNAIAKIALADQ